MDSLLKTPLHSLHRALGAKLVGFAGYEMPLQYPLGILKEHLHTRAQAGLFDVSHMGQIRVRGDGAAQALEAVLPTDVVGLPVGQQRYALLTNDDAGIRDDLMIGHWSDHFLLVVNAACKHADFTYLKAALPLQLEVDLLPQRALLALQGPAARAVLSRYCADLSALPFMALLEADIAGVPCQISCSGYTGEDGFEIAIDADHAQALAERLLAESEVAPIGLGARDSLRLEAGLCLHGHDIDAAIDVISANLYWSIPKVRRQGGAREGGYPGAAAINRTLEAGVVQRRVMLQPQSRAPVREGCEITDQQGRVLGQVTSGGYGPSIERPVAMGYVDVTALDAMLPLYANLRGKLLPMNALTKPPFTARYFRG